MAGNIVSSSFQTLVLEEDLVSAGKIVAKKGTRIILSPQVLDKTVIMGDGRSLAATLPDMQLALSGYQAELIRLSDRITQISLNK